MNADITKEISKPKPFFSLQVFLWFHILHCLPSEPKILV